MKEKDIFIVATYFQKPKNPNRTKEPGYMTDSENYNYEESVNITKGLKIKDELSATVILNLNKKMVVKNTFQNNASFESLLAHYQEGYPEYVNPVLAQVYKDDLNANEHVQSQKESQSD